jgi:Serine/threonine protein kinase
LSELEKLNTKIQKRKENREIQIKPKIAGYPDELFDRYTPIRVLGDDPFATVILVRRNDTGDLRALKIPQNTADIRPSLYTEISLLYQLRHPYVLRMFRAEFSPVMFLELEYVAGARYEGTQRICLSDLPAPLPIDLWLPMIEQISEGLAYIHKQGVRHYHLSPKYILLDEPMTPKISGLIRESLRGAGSSGKEEFFVQAPEQIDPHFFGKTGKKTDIYQLGAIWFWLVTGKIFNHDTLIPESDWEKISFSRFDESLACYDPLLQNLTARFKNDRYSSVEFFLKDLHEASINQGIPMSNSFSDAV